jgi:hypothetical protein
MFDIDIDSDTSFEYPGFIPADLENVEPGYGLAAMLDDIDITQCSG